MPQFSELLNKRRSIREFEDKGVALETIKEVIRDSCLAPSSGNEQPWRFIIVNKKEIIKRLSDESKLNLLVEIEKNPDSPSKKYKAILRSPDFNVFYDAPCLVFIVGAKDIPSIEVDCALVACYFMFSASARGLGTCWIGLGAHIEDPELLNLIGIDLGLQIVAPIIIGYPKGIPEPPKRMEPQILKVVS